MLPNCHVCFLLPVCFLEISACSWIHGGGGEAMSPGERPLHRGRFHVLLHLTARRLTPAKHNKIHGDAAPCLVMASYITSPCSATVPLPPNTTFPLSSAWQRYDAGRREEICCPSAVRAQAMEAHEACKTLRTYDGAQVLQHLGRAKACLLKFKGLKGMQPARV